MTMAIIQESPCRSVFITSQFDQAVGGGARNVQLALAHGRLPRLACEQAPHDLQSRCAIWVVFHPFCPSISSRSRTLLGRLYHLTLFQSRCVASKKGSLPAYQSFRSSSSDSRCAGTVCGVRPCK